MGMNLTFGLLACGPLVQHVGATFLVARAITEFENAKAVSFVETTGAKVCLKSVEPDRRPKRVLGLLQQPCADAATDNRREEIKMVDPTDSFPTRKGHHADDAG